MNVEICEISDTESIEAKFLDALADKNVEKIREILEVHPEFSRTVFKYNYYIIYPLISSVDNLEIVKILIEKGADVHKNIMLMVTAFSRVCRGGYYDVMRFLYEIPHTENELAYGFKEACCVGNTDIVQFLHDKISPEFVIKGLVSAIYEEKIDVINFLAPNYVDPRILHACASSRDLEMLKYVVGFYDFTTLTKEGNILQVSVIRGSYEGFLNCLNYRSIEDVDNFGRTALFYISDESDEKVLEYLFEKADLKHTDCDGNNALMHILRQYGESSRIFEVLENFIHLFDLNQTNSYGKDIFHVIDEESLLSISSRKRFREKIEKIKQSS